MKSLFVILVLLLGLSLAEAQSTLITATVTITNTAGTTNGQTITVNGDTRTWTNSVQVPSSQILTNNSIGGCATNLFNQAADSPFTALSLALSGTNGITLQTAPNGPLSVTLSAGWATVVYTTNILTSAIAVRVPITVETAGQQTNIPSLLVSAIDNSTNSFSGTDVALSNYVSIVNAAQTVAGAKSFTNRAGMWMGIVSNTPGLYGIIGGITNGIWYNGVLYAPVLTNGQNFGNAFSSPGSAADSEQFGFTSTALGINSLAVGNGAQAAAQNSTAIGANSAASDVSSIALGEAVFASARNSTALGASANVPPTHTNSTAIGYLAQTTAMNQIMLGSAGVSVVVNNALNVGTGATFGNGVTNLMQTGTNAYPAGADVSFGRYALTSLANGNNADVPVGTNVFVEVSGPSSSFTINGINGQPNRDGKLVILLNRTGQNMTVANDSGVDSTAANRIYCLTGADKSLTGNGAALLIYNANVTHWILLNFSQ